MTEIIKANLYLLILLLISFQGMAQINPQFDPIPGSFGVDSPYPAYALDINYDEIDTDKQVFHLFLPDTTGNYPLVVYIHGGGFISGDPNGVLSNAGLQNDIKYCLENGIAYASFGYRLIENSGADTEGVIKCLNDAKRALQFVRYHADELKIDPTKIALTGSSAGASASFWLATRSDMADPNATDPVLRESTRVCAAVLNGCQATMDIYKWETQVYHNFDGQGSNYTLDSMENLMGFERGSNFYGGIDSIEQILHDPALIQYREDVDGLFHMSNDDPPIYINSTSMAVHPSQDLFHHAFHGREIQDAALAVDLAEVKANIPALSINTTDGESRIQFLERHLNNCSLTTETPTVNLQIQLYLEGAYKTATESMSTNLLENELLPTEQPFNRPPWNYSGTESLADFNDFPNTVDWILLDIRAANDPFTSIGQQAVLLQADGSIIDPISLTAGADLNMLSVGMEYEIIVRHRNHLDVAGNSSLIAATDNTYDFTDSNNVLGTTEQLVDLGNGKYGLHCGDFNGNGVLTVDDFNGYTSESALINQYIEGDFNLDARVTVKDFNLFLPHTGLIGVDLVRY